METIAVYWEPKIRVYGVSTFTGLSLHTLVFSSGKLAHWGELIASLEEIGTGFKLVNQQVLATGEILLELLLQPEDRQQQINRIISEGCENGRAGIWRLQSPVDLVYMHGPHFQDRYGIAEAAITPVMTAQIPILATGCTGTSIYLVVPDGRAEKAVGCLGTTFVLDGCG
jgi:aspartokinase